MSVFSREEVLGKIVIDGNGNEVGKVVDIAISSKGTGILKVQTETGEVIDIPMPRVQAIGKYIILKLETRPAARGPPYQPPVPPPLPPAARPPPPPGQPPSPPGYVQCPRCGYNNPPGAKFCQNCGTQLPQKRGGILEKLGL